MKTMSNKKKLIPAIAMLLVSAITLGTSTYAWFTMSRSVTATGIQLTAVAPNNLLISNALAGTYAETTAIDLSAITGKLIPASSADGLAFFAADEVKSGSAGAPVATTNFTDVSAIPLTGATDGYYVDVPLWLKTTGDAAVTVTVSQLLSNVTKGAGDPDITGAVRFAVLNGDADDLCVAATNVIYGTKLGTSNVNYFATVTGPVAAAGTTGWAGVAITPNSTNTLFTVPAGGTAFPITVRVWIEGQDLDCIATAAKGIFNLTVGFKDTTYTGA